MAQPLETQHRRPCTTRRVPTHPYHLGTMINHSYHRSRIAAAHDGGRSLAGPGASQDSLTQRASLSSLSSGESSMWSSQCASVITKWSGTLTDGFCQCAHSQTQRYSTADLQAKGAVLQQMQNQDKNQTRFVSPRFMSDPAFGTHLNTMKRFS